MSPPSERTTCSPAPARTRVQSAPQAAQVALHLRGDVRVHRGRDGALVLAELGEDVAGEEDGDVAHDPLGHPGDGLLVDRVRVGVQQADRDRLDPRGHQPAQRHRDALLVERLGLLAAGVQAAADLGHEVDGDQRRRPVVDHEAEQGSGRPRLREVEEMTEALVDDDADLRATALEHRVRGGGGAVHERAQRLGLDARLPADLLEALHDAARLVAGGRRDLQQPHAAVAGVVQEDVGERPSDVDPEAPARGRDVGHV